MVFFPVSELSKSCALRRNRACMVAYDTGAWKGVLSLYYVPGGDGGEPY